MAAHSHQGDSSSRYVTPANDGLAYAPEVGEGVSPPPLASSPDKCNICTLPMHEEGVPTLVGRAHKSCVTRGMAESRWNKPIDDPTAWRTKRTPKYRSDAESAYKRFE